MGKFGRNYKLTVQGSDGVLITFAPPLTVEFDITRNDLASQNFSSIRVYNITEKHKNLIRKDLIVNLNDLRSVQLLAGYGDNLSKIFSGQMSHAWSVREGVNFITQIESYDAQGAFLSQTPAIPIGPSAPSAQPRTYNAGTSYQSIIDDLITTLPGVSPGNGLEGFQGSVGAGGFSPQGRTMDILNESFPDAGRFFIDNGLIHNLDDDECLEGQIQTISSATGLLGTPVREENLITVNILFEPRIIVGQLINLESTTGPKDYNGACKVVGIKHKGIISPAVSGDAVTTLRLFSSNTLKVVQ